MPSSWVVDPAEPSLTLWELQAGGYAETATVSGTQVAELARPLPVRVCPAALVSD